MRGRIHFSTALVAYPPMAFVAATQGYFFDEVRYVTRRPIPLPPYTNLIRPYSPGVWAGVLCSLSALSLAFYLAYWTYHVKLGDVEGLLKDSREKHWSEFVIFTFFKMVEQEPLSWFRKGIAGDMK